MGKNRTHLAGVILALALGACGNDPYYILEEDLGPLPPAIEDTPYVVPTLQAEGEKPPVVEPDLVPAAPLGETRAQRTELSARPQRSLILFASPEAVRLIARRLEGLFERDHPQIDLQVQVAPSRDCIDHLMMQHCAAALISTPLSPAEIRRGLRAREVALRVVVPVVHRSNPIQDISSAQLQRIRRGTITHWSTLGWDAHQILPAAQFLLNTKDQSVQDLRFLGKAAQLSAMLNSDAEIVAYVANRPGGLGLVHLQELEGVRSVRPLRIHGTPASADALRGKTWPLGSIFRIVTPTQSSLDAERFANYLRGEVAQDVLRRHLILPR